MNEYRPEFDERKFRNLVLYIADRMVDIGKTNLYKALWLSDFLAFAKFGTPITGATYVHMPFGPGPDRGEELLDEMEEQDDLLVLPERYYGYTRQRPIALREAELEGVFSASEIALVESVLRAFEGRGAAELSEMSHRMSPGWRLTEDGEVIPYETIFLAPQDPRPADLEQAQQIIAEYRASA